MALPRGGMGLSAVCDCGISLSYSLTIFRVNATEKQKKHNCLLHTSPAENTFYILENTVDPDQLASCESILSESTPFKTRTSIFC